MEWNLEDMIPGHRRSYPVKHLDLWAPGCRVYRAILGQLENVVKNIYPEGGTFAGMLGHMPFLLKDN